MPAAGPTPLVRKLGIQDGARVALIGAPAGFALPGVEAATRLRGPFDVIVCFATESATLSRRLPRLQAALEIDGGLWLAWPKRSSGVTTDLGDAVVRELGLARGLVDNKVCAIDETWSALRFVYRVRDRHRTV